jgi:hypothetical protein
LTLGDDRGAHAHDLAFVRAVVDTLSSEGLRVWLFGGWAEEVLGLADPWPHGDIDLLLLDQDFERVDELVREQEWPLVKSLPHKRAFELGGVTVDLFLVRSDELGYYSEFLGVRHPWPDDVASDSSSFPIASTRSVREFREAFRRILGQQQSGPDATSTSDGTRRGGGAGGAVTSEPEPANSR